MHVAPAAHASSTTSCSPAPPSGLAFTPGGPAAGEPGRGDPRPAGPHRARGQPGRPRPPAAAAGRVATCSPSTPRPGLIELFAGRAARPRRRAQRAPAAPVRRAARRAARSTSRSGPRRAGCRTSWCSKPFLNYDVLAVVGPGAPAGRPHGRPRRRPATQTWMLGPSAAGDDGVVPGDAAPAGDPRDAASASSRATPPRSRRPSAATGSPWRSASRSAADLRRRPARPRVDGPGLRAQGAVGGARRCRRTASSRPPPSCSASSPPRAPPRRWCAAPGVTRGRFRPSVHVTLWS